MPEKEVLLGYLGKATQVGREVLGRVVSPQPFVKVTATADDEVWAGTEDIYLAQVIIIANANNAGAVQFSLYEVVGASNYIDLWAKDSYDFGGVKLSEIHLKFAKAGDAIHLAHTVADGELADMETV